VPPTRTGVTLVVSPGAWPSRHRAATSAGAEKVNLRQLMTMCCVHRAWARSLAESEPFDRESFR
jgi:hypothetical protein